MTIDTQRRIDRLLGVPLCLSVAALSWMIDGRRSKASEAPVRSICVMKFFGIGSIVLTAPFLAELRALHPEARITFLTFAANSETLSFFPQVDRVLSISTDSWWSFARDTLQVIRTLRRDGTDTVFDLEFFAKFSTLLSTLSGAGRRVGFFLPTRWRRWNVTEAVPLDRKDHVSSMFLRQLQILGHAPGRVTGPPMIATTATDRFSCRAKLGLLQNDGPIVVVNANADETSLERRWSPERFAAVIDAVARTRPDAIILLTGTSRERSYVEALRQRCHGAVRNVAGELSLGEFVALLEFSTVVLTNDSGPVHLAAAVGTPVVALFGPESPAYYGPMDGSASFYGGLECSPCLNVYTAKKFVCPYNARCMDAIGVDEVAQAVQVVLQTRLAHVD